jgi:sigma-E processing peptidase SpoIIGA
VDLLSIFFAVRLIKVNVKTRKLIIGALVGGLQAVFYVLFFDYAAFGMFFSIVYFSFLSFYICRGFSFLRKIKFSIAFFLIEIIIGGSVYSLYLYLDNHFEIDFSTMGTENRKLLIFALMVLLTVGIIKLAVSLLSSAQSEKTVELIIKIQQTEHRIDCLVDSGNLACDPIDKSPAVFINKKRFENVFGQIGQIGQIAEKYKSLFRIIPVKSKNNTEIYYGLRYDDVYMRQGKRLEKVKAVLVIGDEESYGGYDALFPMSLIVG